MSTFIVLFFNLLYNKDGDDMKKTIRDLDLSDKRVIIRCDFNVPIHDGKITDDNRIVASLETIRYAMNHGAKVILMSHLGRIKSEEDKAKNSLKVVAYRLSELLGVSVKFVPVTRGELLESAIKDMVSGDVLLMENTRYEDLDGKKESGNDSELGAYWASLADLYVNDAFGTAHRAHASNVGIASHLDSAIGFLIEKELNVLGKAIDTPVRPMSVILGGSKVSDKIGVIENLVNKADYILIGGGMAYTFLKAKGLEIGKSLLDSDNLDFCQDMLSKYGDKIILPIDSVVTDDLESHNTILEVSDIPSDMMGVDIGSKTVSLFKEYLDKSKTIIWNGPVGVFEVPEFCHGTKALLEVITSGSATTIIGGGDTGSAVTNLGYKDKVSHISTGGGASLELMEGKVLPGIDVIKEK